jgi:hypothetical protein
MSRDFSLTEKLQCDPDLAARAFIAAMLDKLPEVVRSLVHQAIRGGAG